MFFCALTFKPIPVVGPLVCTVFRPVKGVTLLEHANCACDPNYLRKLMLPRKISYVLMSVYINSVGDRDVSSSG